MVRRRGGQATKFQRLGAVGGVRPTSPLPGAATGAGGCRDSWGCGAWVLVAHCGGIAGADCAGHAGGAGDGYDAGGADRVADGSGADDGGGAGGEYGAGDEYGAGGGAAGDPVAARKGSEDCQGPRWYCGVEG